MKKIVLIGCGQMGSAIAAKLPQENLSIVAPKYSIDSLKNRFVGASFFDSSESFDVSGCLVILAVKPQKMGSVRIKGKADILCSVLAGTSLSSLKDAFLANAYVRAMPNVAAEFGLSATALVGDEKAKHDALEIFNLIGTTAWLSTEKELDAATALAGSGPAFLALVADAIMDGGVRNGLSRERSKELTIGLFGGFAKLLEHSSPSIIKEKVTSPAGTTAEGLATLENAGIRAAFVNALRAAYKRAEEIKKDSEGK